MQSRRQRKQEKRERKLNERRRYVGPLEDGDELDDSNEVLLLEKPRPRVMLERRIAETDSRKSIRILDPPGFEKMSKVLLDFLKPFLGWVQTKEDYARLIAIGVEAWNIALCPEEDQHDEIERADAEALPLPGGMTRAESREILIELVARKKAHYVKNRRFIIEFEVLDLEGKDIHLNVVSTLEGPPRRRRNRWLLLPLAAVFAILFLIEHAARLLLPKKRP
jgi:hypothetical protein